MDLQVDAELQEDRKEEKDQDSEEDDTELWKLHPVKNKETPNMFFHSTSCGEMILQ